MKTIHNKAFSESEICAKYRKLKCEILITFIKWSRRYDFSHLPLKKIRETLPLRLKKNSDAKKYLKINKFYTNKKLVSA